MSNLSSRVLNMKFMRKGPADPEEPHKKVQDSSEWVLPKATQLLDEAKKKNTSKVVASVGYASINAMEGFAENGSEEDMEESPSSPSTTSNPTNVKSFKSSKENNPNVKSSKDTNTNLKTPTLKASNSKTSNSKTSLKNLNSKKIADSEVCIPSLPSVPHTNHQESKPSSLEEMWDDLSKKRSADTPHDKRKRSKK